MLTFRGLCIIIKVMIEIIVHKVDKSFTFVVYRTVTADLRESDDIFFSK